MSVRYGVCIQSSEGVELIYSRSEVNRLGNSAAVAQHLSVEPTSISQIQLQLFCSSAAQ
jgi:hypothetical protein